MTSLTLPPRPPGSPPLAHAWQTLADGLLTQRLHLHLDEWRAAVAEEKALPDVPGADVSMLAQRPSPLLASDESARALLEDAGLRFWWELPQRHGAESRNQCGALHRAADTAAQNVLAGQPGAAWSDAMHAGSAAAAWWVGFFAVIRHRGVHHITLEPHPGPLHERALGTAVGVVAHGMATRVLETALRDSDDDPALRAAYCRAIEAGVCGEPELPSLVDELAELRLVDLVSTTARWRGRFTKYAGGTGAGQVE
ncbi:hypothetical protein [Streptomyces chromofuscus]|uniref:Uncharacterized protein n=1 Tax=Streptomyces chromofuscus TaxID=42881 RepID=A0A7M2TF52_STRCW|nr:hypothetical protein [Streptomyces chromofuscus]QOV46368.1 hypothetical protein IPT68_10935 [Streptomyces chromofuscus]GGS94924.1 hypothetical protein GCM10010254_13610 [Streptomyces chromofuscus]